MRAVLCEWHQHPMQGLQAEDSVLLSCPLQEDTASPLRRTSSMALAWKQRAVFSKHHPESWTCTSQTPASLTIYLVSGVLL